MRIDGDDYDYDYASDAGGTTLGVAGAVPQGARLRLGLWESFCCAEGDDEDFLQDGDGMGEAVWSHLIDGVLDVVAAGVGKNKGAVFF